MTKTYLFDGIKASLLWDEQSDAWTYFSETPRNDIMKRYQMIPTLFRAIAMNANAVADMPFKIYKGKREIESSQDYQNKLEFLPNPRRTMALVSMSLDLTGRAYLRKASNPAGYTKELQYCAPHTVEPVFDKITGSMTGYKRSINGQTIEMDTKDIIHWWIADPYVEIGPPLSWPAQAALSASNVLGNLNAFVSLYFERGAVRPVIVSVKGQPNQDERDRMERWFNKLMGGIKRAFTWKVFNADTVDIQQIGDGLEQLRDVELTEAMKKDVALAVGIPYAMLFSEAANYATLSGDQLFYYQNTVEPRCELLAAGLNEDLLGPLGYHLEYQPESMDIYQEDEEQRSGSLAQLVNAGVPLLMAMDILGYELTDEQRLELEREKAVKEEQSEEMEQLREQAAANPQPQAQQQNPAQEDMAKWRRKALKAAWSGKSPAVKFDSDKIPSAVQGAIAGALESCTTTSEVEHVFTSVWNGYP